MAADPNLNPPGLLDRLTGALHEFRGIAVTRATAQERALVIEVQGAEDVLAGIEALLSLTVPGTFAEVRPLEVESGRRLWRLGTSERT